MENQAWIILTTVTLYLVWMVIIGAKFAKKGNGATQDFYLGGRMMGPLVTAMSAEASDMSSWLLMGLPGVAYFTGVANAAWTAVGLAVGTYLNWLLVAKKLRIYSAEVGAITLPEFFSKRFADERGMLRKVAAVLILLFFIPYTASGFAAVGKLFHSLFGFDYMTTMLIGAAVICLYTILGGFLAVSTTDLIQSIVMSVAILSIVFFGAKSVGGLGAVTTNVSMPWSTQEAVRTAVAGETVQTAMQKVSMMAWGLGYLGMPHILVRFMGIKDPGKLKTSRRIASVWVVISMSLAVLIGMVGLAMSREGVIDAFNTLSQAETVIVSIANLMSSHGVVAAGLAGLVIAGILASTMSTADSQLLTASSAVSEDLVGSMTGERLTEKVKMRLAKLTVVGISVIAVVLARNPENSVFNIVSFAWAGFGAAFGPVVLMALSWKRMNRWGALAGMFSGAATVFLWKYLIKPLGGIWGIYELLPAFIVALVCVIVISLLTAEPEDQTVLIYERVQVLCSKDEETPWIGMVKE